MNVPGLIVGVSVAGGEYVGARNGDSCLIHGVDDPVLDTNEEFLLPPMRADFIARGVLRDPASTIRYYDKPFSHLPPQERYDRERRATGSRSAPAMHTQCWVIQSCAS